MNTNLKNLSKAEKTALVFLWKQGGVESRKIPDVGEDKTPGVRVFQSLERRGLSYLADAWIDKNRSAHSSSWELTYAGSLLARDISEGEEIMETFKQMG